MGYRNRAAKPSVALWMLVAAADVALILAGAGMLAVLAVASVVTVAVAAVGAWMLLPRATPERQPVPVRATVPMAARRRA